MQKSCTFLPRAPSQRLRGICMFKLFFLQFPKIKCRLNAFHTNWLERNPSAFSAPFAACCNQNQGWHLYFRIRGWQLNTSARMCRPDQTPTPKQIILERFLVIIHVIGMSTPLTGGPAGIGQAPHGGHVLRVSGFGI